MVIAKNVVLSADDKRKRSARKERKDEKKER
jgi:hypothetical protein